MEESPHSAFLLPVNFKVYIFNVKISHKPRHHPDWQQINLASDRQRKLSVHTNGWLINWSLLSMLHEIRRESWKSGKVYVDVTLATDAQLLVSRPLCFKGCLWLTHFKVDNPVVRWCQRSPAILCMSPETEDVIPAHKYLNAAVQISFDLNFECTKRSMVVKAQSWIEADKNLWTFGLFSRVLAIILVLLDQVAHMF